VRALIRRIARARPLLAEVAHELGDDSSSIILAGHSFGADVAIWTAAHSPPPRLEGVLLLSPTQRGHLRVTLEDLANISHPSEPGSFAVADLVSEVQKVHPVAIMRGSSDRLRSDDSALVALASRPDLHVRYTLIPLAGHSLRGLFIAGPMIAHALNQMVAGN
jgi:pimeloyl-ACP methyl ester carboxylesterase